MFTSTKSGRCLGNAEFWSDGFVDELSRPHVLPGAVPRLLSRGTSITTFYHRSFPMGVDVEDSIGYCMKLDFFHDGFVMRSIDI